MVISIIAILAVLAAPAATTILKGSKITQGSQMIGDLLGLARQTALTKNHAIEVRFYQYGDPEIPGESAANPGGGKFRAMQLFDIPDTGGATPLGKIATMPLSIIIDSGNTLSTLISPLALPISLGSAPIASTGTKLQVPLPRVGLQYNSVAFQFLPDGSTNLPPLSNTSTALWFLTVHDDNARDQQGNSDKMTAPPPNFFTVQIDASSGKVRDFRP